MKKPQTFFEFAAEVGLTKHIGGVEATDALAVLCHIEAGKTILDVGCGTGQTACILAKAYGCKVVGVDILDRMVERSKETARRERVMQLVEFRVADAQNLPFENDLFDAVITESVTAFPDDKQRAVNEYVRVTKSGGYVGLNESTWLKSPPPPELAAWASQDLGTNVKPLTASEWLGLLEAAGLKEIVVKTYVINMRDESRGILRRYGSVGMLRIMGRMLALYIKSPSYRRFVKEVQQGGIIPQNLNDYFGYGIYVGCKYAKDTE